jgi:hypothetical protein
MSGSYGKFGYTRACGPAPVRVPVQVSPADDLPLAGAIEPLVDRGGAEQLEDRQVAGGLAPQEPLQAGAGLLDAPEVRERERERSERVARRLRVERGLGELARAAPVGARGRSRARPRPAARA